MAAVLLVVGCRSRVETGPAARRHRALGSFTVDTGRLVVCDPCYAARPGEQDDLQGILKNAQRGEWRASMIEVDAGEWGPRSAELIAHHSAYPLDAGAAWQPATSSIAVDSAQAGIFESKTIDDDSIVPPGWFGTEGPIAPDMLWYSMCCKQTLQGLGAGVVPGGVVSSSGFGDGSYRWCTRSDVNGFVVAIRVVFLTEEDLK